MGLFSFMDFTKEGPGISKNAPKKRAFFAFFDVYFRNFWKFFSINLLYNLLCLPVFTHGFAKAGITNITRNIARDKHSFGISDYFSTIKKNWKQALGVGIVNTIITAILLFGIWFYNESYLQTQMNLSLAGLIMCLLLYALFSMMNYYLYTLMITFDFKFKALYVNSFKFVLLNFGRNLLCGLCLLLVKGIYIFIAVLFFDPRVWLIEAIILIATFPAFRHLVIQFFTFGSIKKHIIDPYYKAHPNADIEQRRNLGLGIPEEEEDYEPPISWEQ